MMSDRLRAFSGQIIAVGIALLMGAIIILIKRMKASLSGLRLVPEKVYSVAKK